MDYEMDVFFIEHWTDPRLKHNESSFIIFSDKTQLDRLWTPDIYFANSKTAQLNFIMVPNMNVRVWPNGRIRLGTRCHGAIYRERVLGDGRPGFIGQRYSTYGFNCEQYSSRILFGDLLRICLLVKFSLQRSIQYSLLQTYFPTTFIVIISWISFWIDPASVPGRIGLALTTLLTLSTQAIAIQFQLPPVGYPKVMRLMKWCSVNYFGFEALWNFGSFDLTQIGEAQDVWFGICLTFLFASLVEFATVNMYMRWASQLMDFDENLQQSEKLNDPSILTPLMPQDFPKILSNR
uniref:Neurotransmitter-gated ion-channel ligand-binding domain-containing protein n=1 Tax=Romanomermis culicivorax TaxID=13658 RepID=A0A915KIF0_ROMCU